MDKPSGSAGRRPSPRSWVYRGVDLRMAADDLLRGGGWSLQALGGWAVVHDGTEVALPPRDQRLLALLLIEGRRPRSVLTARLWPDAPDARASSNLRSTALDLRRRAPGLVEAVAGTLGLGRTVDSDVARLRQLLRGRHELGLVDEARELMQVDELLPGWHEPWVVAERGYLREGVLDRIHHVVHGLVEMEAVDHALPLVRTAIQLEPLRESAHRALVQLYLLSGDRVAAWQVYDDFRRRSVREFGVSPSSRFEEVVEPLRAERRARRAVSRSNGALVGAERVATGVSRRAAGST